LSKFGDFSQFQLYILDVSLIYRLVVVSQVQTVKQIAYCETLLLILDQVNVSYQNLHDSVPNLVIVAKSY